MNRQLTSYYPSLHQIPINKHTKIKSSNPRKDENTHSTGGSKKKARNSYYEARESLLRLLSRCKRAEKTRVLSKKPEQSRTHARTS